jgi:hypothetical protein
MAKQTAHIKIAKPKKFGVQAKSRTSKLKSSKNYRKPYRGQGR